MTKKKSSPKPFHHCVKFNVVFAKVITGRPNAHTKIVFSRCRSLLQKNQVCSRLKSEMFELKSNFQAIRFRTLQQRAAATLLPMELRQLSQLVNIFRRRCATAKDLLLARREHIHQAETIRENKVRTLTDRISRKFSPFDFKMKQQSE